MFVPLASLIRATRSPLAFIRPSWAPKQGLAQFRRRTEINGQRTHEDGSRKMVKRQEDNDHSETKEAGNAKEAVEEDRSNDDFNGRICTSYIKIAVFERHLARTNEGEEMPSKVADSVHIRGHQGHDLSLARKLVFILARFRIGTGFCSGVLVLGFCSRRGDIFSAERFGEEDGVELDFESDLNGGCSERPKLSRD